MKPVPVVLFTYARPELLRRTLASLRANEVPLLLAYSDGAKGAEDEARVREVRAMLGEIDWCEVRITCRPENRGLGRNVLSALEEVARDHESFIAWEDDLVAIPGTYAWLCAALRQFENEPKVMSVTAWTHPRVIPARARGSAYFDGRAECWVWGAWSRSWRGMDDQSALQKMKECVRRGIPSDAYGSDLPRMARSESRRNIWAVRWLYHHLLHGGLCLRPPFCFVEHIGFDQGATNAIFDERWEASPLMGSAPAMSTWPAAVEDPQCRLLWSAAYPGESLVVRVWRRIARTVFGSKGARS